VSHLDQHRGQSTKITEYGADVGVGRVGGGHVIPRSRTEGHLPQGSDRNLAVDDAAAG